MKQFLMAVFILGLIGSCIYARVTAPRYENQVVISQVGKDDIVLLGYYCGSEVEEGLLAIQCTDGNRERTMTIPAIGSEIRESRVRVK